ncbi:hypothetical protein GCM10015535_67630 [Streptomyces gelaticus]|uniref:Uncharacterized protein n=1 Tax=Streptomyces gelaticus TaxID=285446 RepID=A0ABQ2WCB1_9ACTN|nr:hypothetical protein [Streptomyces gelaticus]GGV97061.1 hypothetical protein GCM10015535_67630 [Streptomyces gelaticus]
MPTTGDPVYSGYGLGQYSVRASRHAKLWSHSGGTPGSITETVTTPDGRHTLTYNANGDWRARGDVVDTEFCGAVGKGKQGERPAPRL